MTPALIYTYWHNDAKDPARDMYSPIIPSIATFRYFHKDVPIYVIDMEHSDWGNWPNRLNFKVVQRDWILKKSESRMRKPQNADLYPQMLSRPEALLWLMNNIPENIIIHADSDTIFMKHIFPLFGDLSKISMTQNIGLFYFDKRESQSQRFMETWASMCIAGCHSPVIRDEVIQVAHPCPPIFHEEAVSKYILKKFDFKFSKWSNYENWHLIWFHELSENADIDWRLIKMIHLNYHGVQSEIPRERRGKFFIAIKEPKDVMNEIFTAEEMQHIFKWPHKFEAKSFTDLEYMKGLVKK